MAFVCEYLHFTQNVPSMFDISKASIKTNSSLSIWKILFTVPFQAQLFILATSYLISYRYISIACVIFFANAFRYDCKSHFKNKFVLTIFQGFFLLFFNTDSQYQSDIITVTTTFRFFHSTKRLSSFCMPLKAQNIQNNLERHANISRERIFCFIKSFMLFLQCIVSR